MRVNLGFSLRDALGTLLAAALGAVAFPPLGLWPLSLASICLFLYLVHDKTSAQARQLGLLYGAAYGLGTMYWMFAIFGPLAISFVAIMGGYFGVLATLIGLTRQRSPLFRCALIALFAVAIEWVRGDAWYLRFPWYSVPHALAVVPSWAAPARWFGVYGLSYLIWLIAAAGTLLGARYWAAFLILPACAWLLPTVDPPDRTALLMQAESSVIHESLIGEVRDKKVDLAVLPEYAFPYSVEMALGLKRGPTALSQKLGCPVVFGTLEGDYSRPGFQNVAAVIDACGSFLGTFPKQHPVPMMLDGRPGDRRPVFALDQGCLGIGLCYDFDAPEIAGSLVGNGATLLIAPTGDLLTWGRIQHLHHELLVRLRAIETDRWILRATSSGRSEAIDPHGVPSQEFLDVGEIGTVKVAYAHRSGRTLGSRAYVLGPLAASITVVLLAFWGIRALGRPGAKTQSPHP